MPSKDKPSPLDTFLKRHEDCDRPACDETVSALQSAMNRMKMKEASSNTSSSSPSASSEVKIECPPNTRVLGTSSWNLLHSMAAWYPDTPSVEEQTKMKQFMEALSIFYPCTYCATDFQDNIKKSPVKTESREGLCVWLCEQHNLVNEKLGKKTFNCDLKSLDERWRKSSDPRC